MHDVESVAELKCRLPETNEVGFVLGLTSSAAESYQLVIHTFTFEYADRVARRRIFS